MYSRMSSTPLMAYTLVQSVMLRAPSSSSRVIALKFCLFKETSFVPGLWLWLPALTVVTTGLWSVLLLGITFDSKMSPLV
jgi:hypothetical protein